MADKIEAFKEFVANEVNKEYGYLNDPYQSWQFEYIDHQQAQRDRKSFLLGLVRSAKFLFDDSDLKQLEQNFVNTL